MKALDEVLQEQGIIENKVEETEAEQDDEVSKCPPPDEAAHKIFSPAQQQDVEVSCFPF